MDPVVVTVEALTLSLVLSQPVGPGKAGDDFDFIHEGISQKMLEVLIKNIKE